MGKNKSMETIKNDRGGFIMINILDYGAVGDGVTMNTEAFENAVEEAWKKRSTILVPAGTFLTGTINLRGVSMYLEAGAVIKASGNLEDYPEQDFYHNELGQLRALIVNMGYDHVSITGSGTIDLSGHEFYDTTTMNIPDGMVMNEQQKAECTYPIGKRPGQCIFFYNCKNIMVSGVTILDAPCWTLSFHNCEKVRISNLNIDTDLNIPNDDGIHLCSCKGVTISDCHISSGDDCIALSCITDWNRPCEDIVITNCVLRSCSKAIVIGYIYSVVRNVLISNCIIKESNRGLCIMCHDECALVENVRVDNCIIDTRVRAGNWWGNGEPVFIMAVSHDSHLSFKQKPDRKTDYAVNNVYFSGITCMGENAMGVVGIKDNIRNVVLRNIDYSRKPSSNLSLKGNCFDLAPSDLTVNVAQDCGLLIKDADVKIENVNTGVWKIECHGN